jgi:Z1 domain
MISQEKGLVTMAQTMLRMRFPEGAVGREQIAVVVVECAKLLPNGLAPDAIGRIVAELETRIVVTIGKPTKIVDERGHQPWYLGDRKVNRRFFARYAEFLLQDQRWPQASINALDESSDAIMEELEDPGREGPWDRRGLVVGHVQFGKTANYAGVVNKAVDAGYKLVIVLAGMHNVLRQQTQRRLDRDFLGYLSTSGQNGLPFTRTGVGVIDGSLQTDHLTTQAPNGDFSRSVADHVGVGVQQRPVLLVVKKNASILKNLNTWVREILVPRGDSESRPLLVIDDEADQASVDTGQQDFDDNDAPDPDYEPTRINGQIRKLLSAFSRSAYVAYTVTPFANILIHDAAVANEYGDDLFPRSFIINLPAPSNYVGPLPVFGIDQTGAEAAGDPLPLIRHVDQTGEGWITEGHKKGFAPRFDGDDRIPPSLETAILSFILVCAARAARGQGTAHNSMLVHVSRFKDVHQKVYAQVDHRVTQIKRALKYRVGDHDVQNMLRKLWQDDFSPTSAQIRAGNVGRDLRATAWLEVQRHLAAAVDKIRIQVVNGDMRDAIDYEGNAENGLSLIAIGGDKLSRGLTLEGLSVSYFLRASRMYDSLMQMGRWFGYRPGYVDLCRLYLTPDLEMWFRHVASAAEELRGRLDHMAMIGATPEQYGLRIQSHEILLVTAPNKMRHAREFQVSFQGEGKIQTVFFADEASNRRNAERVTGFLATVGAPAEFSPSRERPGGKRHTWEDTRLWSKVPGAEVASLLGGLLFPDEARDVNAERLASYIRAQMDVRELTEWTVAVLAGHGESSTFGNMTFNTIERSPLERGRAVGRYVVKTILAPRDEAIDLDVHEYAQAVQLSNQKRAREGKDASDAPDGPEIRRVRGSNPRRGLLLLYPLSPAKARLDFNVPIFGVVVSFPDSGSGQTVRYRFNTVAERLEMV